MREGDGDGAFAYLVGGILRNLDKDVLAVDLNCYPVVVALGSEVIVVGTNDDDFCTNAGVELQRTGVQLYFKVVGVGVGLDFIIARLGRHFLGRTLAVVSDGGNGLFLACIRQKGDVAVLIGQTYCQ